MELIVSQQVCTLSLQKALQSKTNFHQGKHQTRQATESCFGIGSQFSSVTHSFFNHVHIHAHGFFGYLIGSTEQNDALLSCLAGVESLALVVLRGFQAFHHWVLQAMPPYQVWKAAYTGLSETSRVSQLGC